jgi:hypothetical protein
MSVVPHSDLYLVWAIGYGISGGIVLILGLVFMLRSCFANYSLICEWYNPIDCLRSTTKKEERAEPDKTKSSKAATDALAKSATLGLRTIMVQKPAMLPLKGIYMGDHQRR